MHNLDPIIATCTDSASAQRTIEALLAIGVQHSDITVISSVPLEKDGEQSEKPHVMPWLVVAGATLGGCAGYLLVTVTQRSYPILTGGMPLVPAWTDGIITYELAMLGAILTTLLVLLWTAHLRPGKRPGTPAATDDDVLVEVALPLSAELREKIMATVAAFSRGTSAS